MTDNQKRAHDIAIFMLGKINIPSITAQEAKDRKEIIEIDFYKRYKEAYTVTLNALNRDFPEGK